MHEENARGRRPDAVDERLVVEVVVYKGRLCADAPEAEPRPDEDIRIHHVHGYNVTLFHAEFPLDPCPVFERIFVCLSVGVGFAGEKEEGVPGAGFGERPFLEDVEDVEFVALFGEDTGSDD